MTTHLLNNRTWRAILFAADILSRDPALLEPRTVECIGFEPQRGGKRLFVALRASDRRMEIIESLVFYPRGAFHRVAIVRRAF